MATGFRSNQVTLKGGKYKTTKYFSCTKSYTGSKERKAKRSMTKASKQRNRR